MDTDKAGDCNYLNLDTLQYQRLGEMKMPDNVFYQKLGDMIDRTPLQHLDRIIKFIEDGDFDETHTLFDDNFI